jgi:hypothetical protein
MSPIWPSPPVTIAATGVISTVSDHGILESVSRVCGQSGASGAWPAASRALAFPVVVATDFVVTHFWTYNGGTASGNRDVGLYDEYGTLLLSTGSVAQSGTSTIQVHDVTDTAFPAGRYLLALAHNDATGTYFRLTTSTLGIYATGVRQMASAFPLPSTFSPAAGGVSSAYWPIFGISTIGVV